MESESQVLLESLRKAPDRRKRYPVMPHRGPSEFWPASPTARSPSPHQPSRLPISELRWATLPATHSVRHRLLPASIASGSRRSPHTDPSAYCSEERETHAAGIHAPHEFL